MKLKNYQLILSFIFLFGIGNINCSRKVAKAYIPTYEVFFLIENNSTQEVELIYYESDKVKQSTKIQSRNSITIGYQGEDPKIEEDPIRICFGTSLIIKFKNGKELKYACKGKGDENCNTENNILSILNYTEEEVSVFEIQLPTQLKYEITEDHLMQAK